MENSLSLLDSLAHPQYGTLDVTDGVPAGIAHISLGEAKRVGPLCKKHLVNYRKVVRSVPYDPAEPTETHFVRDGVAILEQDEATIRKSILERDSEHANTVTAVQKNFWKNIHRLSCTLYTDANCNGPTVAILPRRIFPLIDSKKDIPNPT